MKVLIVDISTQQEIKILNVRITATVTVVAGYYVPVPEGSNTIQTIAEKLEKERLTDLPICLIPHRDFIQSQLFQFPPMPDKEIEKILPREIATAIDSEEPVLLSYMKNGNVSDKQVEKTEIAVFFANRAAVIDLIKNFKASGLKLSHLIPEIQALRTILELNPELGGEKSGLVFLDFSATRVNLNIFKNWHWGMQRDFAFHIGGTEELSDEDLSRISTELNRTFQYFKQKNRGITVDKAFVYGNNPNIIHLQAFIGDNHPVSVSVMETGRWRNKVTLPANLDNETEFYANYTLPLATAVALTGKQILNLFPGDYKEKQTMPRRLIGLSISAAIITLILIAGTFWLEKIKKSYRDDWTAINKTHLSLNRNAAVIESAKRERGNFFKKRFFADAPIKYSYCVSDFIRRLSLIPTGDIILNRLEISPKSQSFTFILKGSIKAGDNIDAQDAFLRFYQELKNFEDMLQITFSTIKVNAGETANPGFLPIGASETNSSTNPNVELFFTISGEVDQV